MPALISPTLKHRNNNLSHKRHGTIKCSEVPKEIIFELEKRYDVLSRTGLSQVATGLVLIQEISDHPTQKSPT